MYVAVVVGIGGDEFFLTPKGETRDPRQAQRFLSQQGALGAARAHIGSQKPVVQRHMKYEVRPARELQFA